MLQIDPEFRALIPPLAADELAGLEASLKAEGCREALVTWNEILLDGHNRKEICEPLGIEYRTVQMDFPDRTAAMLWMIDNQQHRRNLSDIDKIALARKREALLKPVAKAKQIEGNRAGGKSTGKSTAKLPTTSKLDTRKEAAKSAGVGERTYDAGKLVLDAVEKGEIKPEVIDNLRQRKTSIHAAAKKVKENRQQQDRKTKREEAAAQSPPLDTRIIVGDFREHADKIADGSLSLIFTDPPYDREASKMLPALAEFAASKLADGGSLVCYVGQTQLPSALDAFKQHLRYWWTIACVHSGKSTVMREYGVNAGWKAVLWFVKGTRDNNSVMVSDVMSGGQEKDLHPWQQAESEAAYWIDKLCPADGIVCDPFLGSGTTAAAAQTNGRKWIGFELDEATAKAISGRLDSQRIGK